MRYVVMPPGTDEDQRDAYLERLQEMGSESVGAFPHGTEVAVNATATKGDISNIFERLIDLANKENSKAVNMQTMSSDDGASLSQAKVHENVKDNGIESVAEALGDTVNDSLMRYIVQTS